MTTDQVLSVSIVYDKTSRSWIFDQIWFGESTPLPIGDSDSLLPPQAKRGLKALCTLAVLTERARRRGVPVSIDSTSMENLKPLFSARYKTDWPAKLFGGCRPFGSYLHVKQEHGVMQASIADSLTIELVFPDLLPGEPEPTFSAILGLAGGKTASYTDLEIRIRTSGSVISNQESRGALRKGDQIQLEIEVPSEKEICVFWIDSGENLIACLHPVMDIASTQGATRAQETAYPCYIIPGSSRLTVDGTGGTETCMVLQRENGYADDEVERIRTIIRASLPSRNPQTYLETPRCAHGDPDRFHGEQEAVEQQRLGPAARLDSWERRIGSDLRVCFEYLHLFQIPNQGP